VEDPPRPVMRIGLRFDFHPDANALQRLAIQRAKFDGRSGRLRWSASDGKSPMSGID
jgi:hypothetical protein